MLQEKYLLNGERAGEPRRSGGCGKKNKKGERGERREERGEGRGERGERRETENEKEGGEAYLSSPSMVGNKFLFTGWI